ncbi:hypothetical protein E2L07_14485 [Halalkalibacterium halodurans]|uniref:type II toxin-antitoxin system RnlA family toxin n=1 Tax=Halalkalibacterium halodurans TaxID=86665 RepID=UPI001067893E|nr:type II toxin-antitoxin system RnlA family toxin [Halalkalibacterium halodurans]TES52111.1 hypothetical protein E2L07_14485 [Halalkalibacterium halodurans]
MSKKNIFKGLHLNRNMLLQWINEFSELKFSSFTCSELELVGGNQYRCTIVGDGKELLVDFYFNKDDKTTIQPKVGQNQDTSMELATYILGKLEYSYSDIKSRSYSVHPLPEDELDLIIEYLGELKGVKKVNVSRNDTNRYSLYQFKSEIGDKITLTYYDNKRLQIQGKPFFLYQEVTCLLSAYFPFEDVIKNQSEFFSVEISPTEIRDEMKEMLPSAYNYINEELKKVLSASLALQKIDIELEDYSSFVFPALKTLEGYLKQIFAEKGILIKKGGFGKYFGYNSILKKYKYLQEPEIDSIVTIDVIETLYNYVHKHRHTIFHAEAIASATRIIETKQNAELIIEQVISLIETTHEKLNNPVSS